MVQEVVFRRLGLLTGLLVGIRLIGFDFRDLVNLRSHGEGLEPAAGTLFAFCAMVQMARTWYIEPAVHGKVRFRVSITVTMRDLLTAARNNGALVDGEMIKYIRSTV